MFEICITCNRTFYARDYPPRVCPVCEEEAHRRGESLYFLTSRKQATERLVPRF